MHKITFNVSGTNTAAFLEVLLKGHPAVSNVTTEEMTGTPFSTQLINIVDRNFRFSAGYFAEWLRVNNIKSIEEAIEKTRIVGMAEFLQKALKYT